MGAPHVLVGVNVSDGKADGTLLGDSGPEGAVEGDELGTAEGIANGDKLGTTDGLSDGDSDGTLLGESERDAEGLEDIEEIADGDELGL